MVWCWTEKAITLTKNDKTCIFHAPPKEAIFLFIWYQPMNIPGRKLGMSGVSPNQRSRWKHALSLQKYV